MLTVKQPIYEYALKQISSNFNLTCIFILILFLLPFYRHC